MFFFSLFLHFQIQDTRTHIVVELFNTEKSYVESLETVVKVRIYFICLFSWDYFLTLNLTPVSFLSFAEIFESIKITRECITYRNSYGWWDFSNGSNHFACTSTIFGWVTRAARNMGAVTTYRWCFRASGKASKLFVFICEIWNNFEKNLSFSSQHPLY